MTLSENIAQAFGQWERKLRGWDVFPHTVELEPALVPLHAYFEPPKPGIDDGRRETLLSGLTNRIVGYFNSQENIEKPSKVQEDENENSDEPDEFHLPNEEYISFRISLPSDFTGSLITYKNLLQSLRYSSKHLSFEIVGSSTEIILLMGAWHSESNQLLQQIRAHLPEATVIQNNIHVNTSYLPEDVFVIDFGLEHEVLNPISRITDLKFDPLRALIGGMEELKEGEQCIFQILFKHTDAYWETHLRNSVIDVEGKPLFTDGADMVKLIREKTSSPLYACIVRLCVCTSESNRKWELAKTIGGSLAQYDVAALNNLMPLTNDEYDDADHWQDVIDHTTHRSGMLLSLDELVGLLHCPDEVVKSEKLLRQRIKTKSAPDLAVGHELVLGSNEHRGVIKEVSLSQGQRSRHMYIVGASGTGKSTLLLNCIRQDIESGEGLCVLDPHGDLIDQALGFVPDHRFNDVILLDPSDEEFPIGFNILHAHSNLEKTLLASDLSAVFERLSTTWGDQMDTVISNGILAFLESDVGGTLVDLRRFLVEKDFRFEFLETVKDNEVVYYWKNEFPLLSGRPQAPVLTRLNTFLRPKPIRHMVAQKQSSIDFAEVMDSGKILFAKLSHGGIGEENAYLLGALLASKIHQTALSRQAISLENRRPFALFIDEFQNFVTPSIAQTLSGARKYGLSMVLAHQELTQLSIQDKAIAASVIANPYTRICFRMGDRDARTLSEGFSEFNSKDLQSLGIGEAIGRIEQAKFDFSLITYPLPEIDQKLANYKRLAIQKMSRGKYATPLADVESIIKNRGKKAKETEKSDSKLNTKVKTESKKDHINRPQADERGKGGGKHKKLQLELQAAAQKCGFGATIEKHIGGGQHIDVEINTSGKRIACEISVTTTTEHEVGNIQKCITAGYTEIWMVSDDAKLNLIETLFNSMNNTYEGVKVQFINPTHAEELLRNLILPMSKRSVRGFKFARHWTDLKKEEKTQRETVLEKLL